MEDLFSAANGEFNPRSRFHFRVPGINIVFYGANSLRCFGSAIENSLKNYLRNISTRHPIQSVPYLCFVKLNLVLIGKFI